MLELGATHGHIYPADVQTVVAWRQRSLEAGSAHEFPESPAFPRDGAPGSPCFSLDLQTFQS